MSSYSSYSTPAHERVAELRTRLRDILQHEGPLTKGALLSFLFDIIEVLDFLLDSQDQVDLVVNKFFSKPIVKMEEGAFENLFGKVAKKGEKEPKKTDTIDSPYLSYL